MIEVKVLRYIWKGTEILEVKEEMGIKKNEARNIHYIYTQIYKWTCVCVCDCARVSVRVRSYAKFPIGLEYEIIPSAYFHLKHNISQNSLRSTYAFSSVWSVCPKYDGMDAKSGSENWIYTVQRTVIALSLLVLSQRYTWSALLGFHCPKSASRAMILIGKFRE